MENKIRTIIFDLGNVLVGFDHRIAVNRILRYTKKSAEEIYDLFFDSQITRDFEKGKLSPLDFFAKVKDTLGLNISWNEFLPIWNEIFFPKSDTEEFILSLGCPKDASDTKTHSNIKLVLLSNINKLHYDYVKNNFYSAISLFDEVIPSYMTGFIKPEKEIYDLAFAHSGATLENSLYIDDRLDLVEAARSYGIKSIRFQNIQQLKQEFQNLGIPFRDGTFCKKGD